MDNLSLFDLLPEEEGEKYKPIKSTDWKWTMAEDYPKEKNGLKVFSCFACGGALRWDTSSPDAMSSDVARLIPR